MVQEKQNKIQAASGVRNHATGRKYVHGNCTRNKKAVVA
jgi:hypothetical protein